ncbi:MAG: FecR domain-containing protein [Alphaproteobacteria bacterium]|nr:FecR domain-containing protein [Alphaproteobacteria bacterium]
MLLIRTLLVLFLFAAGAQSVSAAEAWRIVASTGAVKSGAPGVMPVAVNSKQTLPADSWVETAATGRLVVARGLETIAIGPNSRVMLPALPVNGNTQVLQTVGTALYQIGKQKAPHFQVDTPYLAAVVKGTTFTVSVSEGAASVDVSEGLVEVATPDRADTAFVQPGFTGFVKQGQRDKVVVVPTTDGSIPGSSPKDGGGKSKLQRETSNTKGRVVITAAIGEVALDVKSVSGGLATGTDSSAQNGGTKVASAAAGVVSNASDVVHDTTSDGSASTSGATVNVSSDGAGASASAGAGGVASIDVSAGAGGASAGVDVGGGAAAVDVSAGAGGASAGVDVGGGAATVDVGAGSGGVSVGVGVGGGNGNGNGLALGVGVGAGGGGVTVGIGVGNGGVGLGLSLGNGGGGLGLGLGGGRGS